MIILKASCTGRVRFRVHVSSILCVQRIIRLTTLQYSESQMDKLAHYGPDDLHLTFLTLPQSPSAHALIPDYILSAVTAGK